MHKIVVLMLHLIVQEETGYVGVLVRNADLSVESDPGLTNANLQLVHAEIDLDDRINADPFPAMDDSDIQTILFPMDTLKEELDKQMALGIHVDSRLYHFAAGLDFAKRYM